MPVSVHTERKLHRVITSAIDTLAISISEFRVNGEIDAEVTDAIESIATKVNRKLESLQQLLRSQESAQEGNQSAHNPRSGLLEQLQQENRELKRANEILRNVATFFASTQIASRTK